LRRTPNELIVGQPLAGNPINHTLESVSIVTLTSVEAEGILYEVKGVLLIRAP